MTTPDQQHYSDLISVKSRFGRSVNLERDFYEQASLDGYVLTSTARSALQRLANGLSEANSSRSWTVTGPYGSGKSAYALFTAKVMSRDDSADTQAARNLIKEQDKELWHSLFDRRRKTAVRGKGLSPVLISGSREPIGRALLRGLASSIQLYWPDNPPLLLGHVRALLKKAEAGKAVTGRQIVEVFEQTAREVCADNGGGLLIVVDELGKLLEYAAAHPYESDIFLLQELAEAAKRSQSCPILVITILHQAFDRYFERLGRAQKDEWMKVHGRFEDITFQEPIEQVLRILANAIHRHGPKAALAKLHQRGLKLAQEAEQLELTKRGKKKEDVLDLLAACFPFHPAAALIAGQLFRKLGQNERSLFAFLTSHEPYGLQEFLTNTPWKGDRSETVTLSYLYDYITTALGSGLYAQGGGKKWAEIETALNRFGGLTELGARLIKTIGMLNVVGDIGSLKPSTDVLKFAVQDQNITSEVVDLTLERLKDSKVIIFRRYSGGYSLWEGSDVDLEERLVEARAHVDANAPLSESLMKYFRSRPMVARRHSLKTGTLRFFEFRYADNQSFSEVLSAPATDADGLIIYAVAANADDAKRLTEKAQEATLSELPHVLIAVAQESTVLREVVMEVACLRWVRDKTPELEGDRTARRELQARLSMAESLVEQQLQSFFESSAEGGTAGQGDCKWYRKGKVVRIHSSRALQEYISDVCDEVFSKTPLMRNELINRRRLSSSAAAARRELIAAMLEHGDKPSLGMEGFPPQLSMYYSLLESTGIHREEGGRWGFLPPPGATESGVIALWAAIDEFFTTTETKRRPVTELYDKLKQPPYGLKDGPLPVLLCAAFLHYDTEIALYDQGSFVPILSTSVFDLIIKAPEKFSVQRYRVAKVRAAVFEGFSGLLSHSPQGSSGRKPNLLTIVRPLSKFATSLPAYTRNTQRLSPAALRVRDSIFEAREPDQLIFVKLPEACGYSHFDANDDSSQDVIDGFFKSLRVCLAELQRAYPEMLNELEKLLTVAFTLRGAGEAARQELKERAERIWELAVEPKLKSFLVRVRQDNLDQSGWLESIATLLATKPPALWNDTDLAQFEVNLAEVARSFSNIEVLSFELRKRRGLAETVEAGKIIRLGITTLTDPERQKVLTVGDKEQKAFERAEAYLDEALTSAGINGDIEGRLAVLALMSQKLLQRLDEGAKDASLRATLS